MVIFLSILFLGPGSGDGGSLMAAQATLLLHWAGGWLRSGPASRCASNGAACRQLVGSPVHGQAAPRFSRSQALCPQRPPAPRLQSAVVTGRTWTSVAALTPELAGQPLLVRARVHTVRGKGKSAFLVLRQATATVQASGGSASVVAYRQQRLQAFPADKCQPRRAVAWASLACSSLDSGCFVTPVGLTQVWVVCGYAHPALALASPQHLNTPFLDQQTLEP